MVKVRQLNQEEQSLWDEFTNKIQVADRQKYKNKSLLLHKSPPAKKVNRNFVAVNFNQSQKLVKVDSFIQHYKAFKSNQEQSVKDSFMHIGERKEGIDNATWKRFQKGEIKPEQILDLHGYTAQRAFFVLEEFLIKVQRKHVRCVEIITGIGTGYKEGGILKRELPYWLNRPVIKSLILASNYPTRWNGGAVRILLRRNRL